MPRRVVPILVCLVLSVACGARLTDEQRAAVLSDDDGSSNESEADGGDGDGVTTTTAGAGSDDGSGDGASVTTVAGGDGGQPSGDDGSEQPGGGVIVIGGSTCGGGGSSDVGVTDEEIRIGNVSTISGPIPGFGQTGVNAVKAYVNFVNASGGVCGRKLVLVTGDDRLQSGTNKAETDKLKEQVLAFVGAVTVVDDGAAQSLEGTNIAYIGLGIADAMVRLPNNFSSTPLDLETGGNGAASILRYMKAERGVTKAAIIYPAQATARGRALGYKKDLAEAGIPVVLETEVAVTETNYADDATAIEASGADLLLTTLELSGMARLAKALDQNGYFPAVPFYGAQAYGRLFLQQAGAAAEPTVLGLAYHIFEEADSIPAVQNFLTWYQRTNPGQDIDFFAIESWVAADMFVSALQGIDGAPTRDALLAQLRTFTAFDAHGFKAPINPAEKKPTKCFLVAEVEDGAWVKAHPAGDGLECGY